MRFSQAAVRDNLETPSRLKTVQHRQTQSKEGNTQAGQHRQAQSKGGNTQAGQKTRLSRFCF